MEKLFCIHWVEDIRTDPTTEMFVFISLPLPPQKGIHFSNEMDYSEILV